MRTTMGRMFTTEERLELRKRLVGWASSDERVVAGAVVGSLALDEGDEWSDLDIMFAVAPDAAVADVLEQWSRRVVDEFSAVHLFDFPREPVIYRVFLLPGGLELDLSFAPAAGFAPSGPKVDLLFGELGKSPEQTPTQSDELFGYAVHHALHARAAIERQRFWQAEYWVSAVRDYALHLACLRYGLDGWYGRDFDDLPAEALADYDETLVSTLSREELLRALGTSVERLLNEAARSTAAQTAGSVEAQLREVAGL
jgi:predicted nucleotidyltransferase